MEATKYELTTIKDIHDKVPLDRIEDCMSEITALLVQSKTTAEAITGLAKIQGLDCLDVEMIKFPETLDWIDDGKGEITMKLRVEGGNEIVSITTKHATNEEGS